MSEELAWAAGFLDGEGCVFVHGGGQIRVCAVNTDRRPIDILQNLFGGNVRLKPSRREKHRDTWEWEIVGPRSLVVLRMLRPYLMVKPEQADLAIEFGETTGIRGRHISDATRSTRHLIDLELRRLKHV